jgi:hypothetical protein
MSHATFRSLVFIGAMIGIAAPVYAQQTPDAPKAAPSETSAPVATTAPAATAAPSAAKTSTAAATPDVPSADILKKARNAGLHTKVKQGVVYYCKTEADMGSRFTSERCYDENQLAQFFITQQAARDQFSNRNCSGSACSGK